MLIRHARQQMGEAARIRDGISQPAPAPPVRIPHRGEPDSPFAPPGQAALVYPERCTLAAIGKRLGRQCLAEVACVAKPDTILAWYRRLIARKFDGSQHRSYPGRPRLAPAVEALIVRMAQENSTWGYDRIAGALANLGHRISDQTIGNVLKRHGIAPAPKRSQSTNWKDFIVAH